MDLNYIDQEEFVQVNFNEESRPPAEYEYCVFRGCDLSGSNLSNCRFLSCEFYDCNLSNAKLNDCSFQEVQFHGCKMLGLSFEVCRDFGFGFSAQACQLNHSIFYGMKLGKCSFINCQMHEVDFVEADLGGIQLSQCDLLNASFEQSNLAECDLRASYNYQIGPVKNFIRGARFSMPEAMGLLSTFEIQIEKA